MGTTAGCTEYETMPRLSNHAGSRMGTPDITQRLN
jgi:hypothetical protein